MKKRILIISLILLISFNVFSQSVEEFQDTTINYTDSYGNQVSLSSYPERIVSLTPNITETLFALDAGDLVVARSNYCNYPEECLTLPSVGDLTNPSIEDIVALKPDLIIAGSIVTEETFNTLKELGLKVVIIAQESSLKGTYSQIKDIGYLTNRDQQAKTIIENMKVSISQTQAAIKASQPISTYYCVSFGEWGDYGATGDTFINDLIVSAGGDNIAKNAMGWSISREILIDSDPKVVILPSYSYSTFENDKEKFSTTEPYSNLTAAKEEGIYTVNGDTFDRQGPRNAEAIRTLAEILHPDCF